MEVTAPGDDTESAGGRHPNLRHEKSIPWEIFAFGKGEYVVGTEKRFSDASLVAYRYLIKWSFAHWLVQKLQNATPQSAAPDLLRPE
jgi:hypothetical protein